MKRLVILFAAMVAACTEPGITAPTPQPAVGVFGDVEYLSNYDGDTVTVRLEGMPEVFGGGSRGIGVRVAGIDTPERYGRRPCERATAAEAKDRVKELLEDAERIDLENVGRGKYFRLVARIVADGADVGAVLIAEGLAVQYDGGRKPVVNWCEVSR